MLSSSMVLVKMLRSEVTRLMLAGFVVGGIAMASMPGLIDLAETVR